MTADGSPQTCRHGIAAGNYCAKCGHEIVSDPTQRAEATTTLEGAKGWDTGQARHNVPGGGNCREVAPNASPEGVRAETRRQDDRAEGEPSNALTAADGSPAVDTIRRALEHAGRNDWSDEPANALTALDALVAERDTLRERAETAESVTTAAMRDRERIQSERDSARHERDSAHLALVRIHSWAGRALAATPDIDLGEQGKAILEDVYAEASEQVELGESKP